MASKHESNGGSQWKTCGVRQNLTENGTSWSVMAKNVIFTTLKSNNTEMPFLAITGKEGPIAGTSEVLRMVWYRCMCSTVLYLPLPLSPAI